MSKVSSPSGQTIPVNPESVAEAGAPNRGAPPAVVPAQGDYRDHVTSINMDVVHSEAEGSTDASTEASSSSSLVELDLESGDGQSVQQRLLSVPIRLRDASPSAASPRRNALESHMANCMGKTRPCSQNVQAVLGLVAMVSGIGMMGFAGNTSSPYAWAIGGVGTPLFLAGATIMRYSVQEQ